DTAFEAGVRVQIHSQAEPPFVHELGFGVAPGFQTFVATQEQRPKPLDSSASQLSVAAEAQSHLAVWQEGEEEIHPETVWPPGAGWRVIDTVEHAACVVEQMGPHAAPPGVPPRLPSIPRLLLQSSELQEQELTYLPPPWGECESKALESGFFQVYSVTACRIDCETRYIVENCNCRMVHMPGDAPFCTPEQYKDCAEPALAKLSAVESSNCMCRTPCNMTRYNKELSMVKIPSKTSARYLQKKFNKTEKYITDNILVLDVFFEALNYETIEQKKAYEVAGLLGKCDPPGFSQQGVLESGDIGGQMGLFIGASILTILELFDYAYEVVKDRLLDLLSREEEEESHGED
ncbi:hypothetical protein INR49_003984, partial [Caranx melampygus]